MVDVWSDDVGQPDRHGRMVYRQSDSDSQSGMMDGLPMVWTDSATDLRVDKQMVGAGGMTDGLVAQQTDVGKDRQVV